MLYCILLYGLMLYVAPAEPRYGGWCRTQHDEHIRNEMIQCHSRQRHQALAQFLTMVIQDWGDVMKGPIWVRSCDNIGEGSKVGLCKARA